MNMMNNGARSIISQVYLRAQKKIFEQRYGLGEDIIKKDWDYLIILDSCRHDIFSIKNSIHGDLTHAISKGSHSAEFAKKNFQDRNLYDIVYTTANAYGARIGQGSFHDIIFTERQGGPDDWASQEGMHPKSVCKSAISAHDKYPNKRHIIHFMQPHSPYFGRRAEGLRKRLAKNGICELGSSQWSEGPNLKLAVKDGLISISDFKDIYIENLEFVLDYVDNVCNKLNGKIVITSDHGELLGNQDGIWKYSDDERQTPDGTPIGHPRNVYIPELRRVPYLVIESGNRPEITYQDPEDTRLVEDDKIENRLRQLGYM